MKLRHSHFTHAAKCIFLRKRYEEDAYMEGEDCSPFCCDYLSCTSIEQRLFEVLFKPKRARRFSGWWPLLPGFSDESFRYSGWDYESRILALLLAAEISRNGEAMQFL